MIMTEDLKIIKMIELHQMGVDVKDTYIETCPGKVTKVIFSQCISDPIIKKFLNGLDRYSYSKYQSSRYTYEWKQDRHEHDLVVSNVFIESPFVVETLYENEVFIPNVLYVNCAFKYPRIEERSTIYVDCDWSES